MEMYTTFGAPKILNSDNESQIVYNIINELHTI